MKEVRKIIAKYRTTDRTKEKLALATVVSIEESSYRRIGARMLVSSNGTWTGGISGGCLEGDALRRSQKAIFSKQPSIVSYDTLDEAEQNIGIGLGCNGKIDVLFVPIDYDDPSNPIELLTQAVDANEVNIIIHVIEANSSTDILGKMSLVLDSNTLHPSLAFSIDELRSKIEETRIRRRPQFVTLNHANYGPVKLLVEYLRPEYRLVIIGDNYDVLAMTELVRSLGWQMHIVGRKKKMTKPLLASARQCYEYEEIEKAPIDEHTAVILMTHDFNWDKKLLPGLVAKKPVYLGMLGPKKRMEKMKIETGINLDKVPFFHSPIGLDIGAETPEEIALSILSEIVACFRNRDGRPLKFRTGTIHEREID